MKNFLVILVLGCTSFIYSQAKLSGKVSGPDGTALQGVIVSMPEINKEVSTDSNGNYSFNNIPSGNFLVLFSHIGFAKKSYRISFAKEAQQQDVVMELSEEHMDEVIVSTAFNKLQSQNVTKVDNIKMENLRKNGSLTLAEGLTLLPGVSSVSTGISIGKPVIRGLSGNRVVVYSQGVRMENQQFGEEHGLGLNDSGIESVEVIKGPASLLYGSDALGGVLYFNPEKFAPAGETKAHFGQRFFSNTQGSSTSLGINTASEKWKIIANYKHDIHADYKTGNNERVTNTRFNESDFKAALGYSSTIGNFTLRYNFNNLSLGIPEEGIGEQSTAYKPLYPSQNVKNRLISLNSMLHFGKSRLETNVGYTENNRKEFEDNPSPVLNMVLKTLNYDAKLYLFPGEQFETIVGVQGMYQENSNFGEERLIPDATVKDLGSYLTTRYEKKSHTLQAGFRYDLRKVTANEYGTNGEEGYFMPIKQDFNSFNASLGYKNASIKNLILRATIATGFRAPNLAELTSNGVHEGSNRYEIGNPNLKNEKNIQIDLNSEFKTSHVEFFANAFYNHINDYIYIAPTGEVLDENNVFVYLQQNSTLIGGEAGLHFHPHPLDWLHITGSYERVSGKSEDGANLPLIPANRINSEIRLEFNPKNGLKNVYFTLGMQHYMDQKKASVFETPTDGYTLLNLGSGAKIKGQKVSVDFRVNVSNLTDKVYIPHLSRLKPDGIPSMGRNITFGAVFSI